MNINHLLLKGFLFPSCNSLNQTSLNNLIHFFARHNFIFSLRQLFFHTTHASHEYCREYSPSSLCFICSFNLVDLKKLANFFGVLYSGFMAGFFFPVVHERRRAEERETKSVRENNGHEFIFHDDI